MRFPKGHEGIWPARASIGACIFFERGNVQDAVARGRVWRGAGGGRPDKLTGFFEGGELLRLRRQLLLVLNVVPSADCGVSRFWTGK